MSQFPKLGTGQTFGQQSATKWNRLIEEVEAWSHFRVGDGLLLTKRPGSVRIDLVNKQTGSGSVIPIRHFMVKDALVSGDYVQCVTSDGDGANEGTSDVYVALPWMLRRTSLDTKTRNDIDYEFTSDSERVATRSAASPADSISQTEVRVISIVAGDVFLAAKTLSSSGLTDPDENAIVWEALIYGVSWATKHGS